MYNTRLSFRTFISAFFMTCRPKTLPIACMPILVGTSLAKHQGYLISWTLAFLAIAVSVCIQIATNWFNDAIDFTRGTDDANRLGPIRAIQRQLLSPHQILFGGITFCLFACLLCLPLINQAGWPMAFLLSISIFLSYSYSAGPFPLSYLGLGDLFVFIFYGFVNTTMAYYLQTSELSKLSILIGIPGGLLSTLPIAINNFRDTHQDAKANKKTLAVRFGYVFSRFEIIALFTIPYFVVASWAILFGNYLLLAPWLTLPLAILSIRKIWDAVPCRELNQFFAKSIITLVLFTGLLSTALWFS